MEGSFAEPADVRPDSAAAGAAGNFGGRFVEVDVIEGGKRAGVAPAFEELTVHMEDAAGTGPLVEIVDILGTEKKSTGDGVFESSERAVARIGSGGGGNAAAHGVEIPDEARVATPGVRRGDVLEAVVAPQAAGIAESGNAALGTGAGAGEDEDAVRRREG
jgi:hypothetical protein